MPADNPTPPTAEQWAQEFLSDLFAIHDGSSDAWHARCMALVRAHDRETTALAIKEYIDEHGVRCEGCGHTLIDVTAQEDGAANHCLGGGNVEGDGLACGHCFHVGQKLPDPRFAALEADVAYERERADINYRACERLKRKSEDEQKRANRLEAEMLSLRADLDWLDAAHPGDAPRKILDRSPAQSWEGLRWVVDDVPYSTLREAIRAARREAGQP